MTRPGWAWRPADDIAAALPAWAVARVIVFAAWAYGYYAHHRLHPTMNAIRLNEGLMGWDGQWYNRIAAHGYAPIAREALRFFPLYAWIGSVGKLIPGGTAAVLLVVANAAALALGALIHRLALAETGDPALARRAAWLVAVVPPAFVLVMAYPEGLFGCLAIGTFLCMRKGRWSLAAVWAVLAGLTRPVGLFLAVPMTIEALRGRQVGTKTRLLRLAGAGAPVGGAALYLGYVQAAFGSWRLPFKLQNAFYLRGGVANPVVALIDSGRDFVSGRMDPNGLHFLFGLLFVVLIVVAFRTWPASYGAFATVSLLAALSAHRLGSLERYGFGAFPIVLALATVLGKPLVERAVLAVSGALMFAYTSLAFFNVYVP